MYKQIYEKYPVIEIMAKMYSNCVDLELSELKNIY